MAINANANGIPFLRRYGIPLLLKNSMILWYDIARQGATNESMAENPILKDLSGNGHDATCYNFAWSGMSGIGGYATSFLGYSINNDGVTISDSVIRCIAPLTGSSAWILDFNKKEFPQTKVKISNIPDGEITYYYINETGERKFLPLTNGEHELPKSYSGGTSSGGFYKASAYSNVNFTGVTIELIPQYPNALVSDGVDDYACTINNIQVLDDYTIIVRRSMTNEKNTSDSYIAGKSSSVYTDAAFMIDNNLFHQGYFEGGVMRSNITVFGYGNHVPRSHIPTTDTIIVSTPDYYMAGGKEEMMNRGVVSDNSRPVTLFKSRISATAHHACALYSFLLFNRTLAEEEIEWVKTNLIETEQ